MNMIRCITTTNHNEHDHLFGEFLNNDLRFVSRRNQIYRFSAGWFPSFVIRPGYYSERNNGRIQVEEYRNSANHGLNYRTFSAGIPAEKRTTKKHGMENPFFYKMLGP